MKKTLKLIPAIAMLLISAVLVSTSTYAWFSMNQTVTATGMTVKAQAEKGIVISNTDKATWSNSSEAKVPGVALLVPTSAAAITSPAFVHAYSTSVSDADQNQALTGSQGYTDLTLTWSDGTNSAGVGSVDTKNYVLLNKFYIRSSDEAITSTTLKINKVESTGANKAVENSLRVLVVVGSSANIYAPVIDEDSGTTTLSYKWKGTTDVVAKNAKIAAGYNITTGITTIPAYNEPPIEASIYVYFEGEDANCKSVNMNGITANNITVTVTFGITDIATPAVAP